MTTDRLLPCLSSIPVATRILYVDDGSKDNTWQVIDQLCKLHANVMGLRLSHNVGQQTATWAGMESCINDADAVICMDADLQDPPELIPELVKYWEEGNQVVCGIKTSSKENKFVYWLRSIYYKLIKSFSSIEQIEHFTGFGLYDRSFIEILKKLDDPTPFLRGIVAEFASPIKYVEYEQQQRRNGITHNNFYTLYDAAMLSFTSYTKIGMRIAVFLGLIFAFISFIIGIIYLIMKLIYWDRFYAGQAPTIIITSFMCSTILILLGFVGEYISSINQRVIHRPLVIEKDRINFKNKNGK